MSRPELSALPEQLISDGFSVATHLWVHGGGAGWNLQEISYEQLFLQLATFLAFWKDI